MIKGCLQFPFEKSVVAETAQGLDGQGIIFESTFVEGQGILGPLRLPEEVGVAEEQLGVVRLSGQLLLIPRKHLLDR